MEIVVSSKVCPKCNIERHISFFSKDSSRKDKLQCYCIPCRKNKYQKEKANGTLKRSLYKKNPNAWQNGRNYYLKNKEKCHKRQVEYKRKKRVSDISFRLIDNARARVSVFLKNKNDRYSRSIGCTKNELKIHIESQFQPGMTWENYGEWHIDHKYPLSIAYKEGQESFKKACHYTNLQPLWARDNLQKGAKINE